MPIAGNDMISPARFTAGPPAVARARFLFCSGLRLGTEGPKDAKELSLREEGPGVFGCPATLVYGSCMTHDKRWTFYA
jgi:hypothetical protein